MPKGIKPAKLSEEMREGKAAESEEAIQKRQSRKA